MRISVLMAERLETPVLICVVWLLCGVWESESVGRCERAQMGNYAMMAVYYSKSAGLLRCSETYKCLMSAKFTSKRPV